MSTNQQALIAALSAASPTLLENLISYWKLDESSGDAADSIGGNTLTNTNTVTYASAKINNGAVLSDASKQTLRKASNTIFPTGSATSVSAWVKFNSFGAVGYPSTIVTGGDVDSPYVRHLLEYVEYPATVKHLDWVRQPIGTTLSFTLSPTWAPSTATWYHIVATYDASWARLYVNGSQLGSDTAVANLSNGTGPGSPSTAAFILGRQWYTGDDANDRYLDGTLDEVGIWSKALTTTEISALYNGGNGLQYPF